MKIPKYIEESIKKIAYHQAIAAAEDEKVRHWLQKKNMLNDYFIDNLIDGCTMGNNPDNVINVFENATEKEYGNNIAYIEK